MHLILDTGPWVALLCRNERHHIWAKEQIANAKILLTCEAVVAETCFLLARSGFDPGKALAFIERGLVQIGMSLEEEITSVRTLFERYDNVPASLADACLIRMTELYEPCHLLTLDSDFHIYRRQGQKSIPVITPE